MMRSVSISWPGTGTAVPSMRVSCRESCALIYPDRIYFRRGASSAGRLSMGRGQQGGHRRWLMLAVFILTAGAGWFQAAEPTGTFSLAILRRDGILLPFANYD